MPRFTATQAACRTVDAEIFFPDGRTGSLAAEVTFAKSICGTCGVRGECLKSAVLGRESTGIWGGYTTSERHRIVRDVLRKALVPQDVTYRLLADGRRPLQQSDRLAVLRALDRFGWGPSQPEPSALPSEAAGRPRHRPRTGS